MKRLLALFAFSAVAALAQTPTITAVLNNYGRIPASASNFGIAQGALFIVKGANLSAQADTTLQNPPLQTTLAAVRVRITSNGVVTYAPIYYVLSTQIAAVLPSTIALSNSATVIIEKNGVNSAPFAFKVVKSAYGQLSWEFETGTGRAIVVKLDGTLAGLNGTGTTNVLNPNEVIILYGSGLGPISTSDALAPTPTNMADVPITVNIGGVNAEVLYRGRSTFAALDQINIRIPALAANSYNCNVTMLITVGGVDANPTTLPIAASGTACTNPNPGGGGGNSGTNFTQQEISTFSAQGFYRSGGVQLERSTDYQTTDQVVGSSVVAVSTVKKEDTVSALFTRTSGADVGKYLRGELPPGFPILTPAVGSCVVYTASQLTNPYPNLTQQNLDAGAAITSNGPNGVQLAARQTHQNAGPTYAATNVPATYLAQGRYTLTGPGGADVGPFSGTLDITHPDLMVTNPDDLKTTINRAGGITVRWTGGDPNTILSISGQSFGLSGGAGFVCIQNTSAGVFNVPAGVLTQLPASSTVGEAPFVFVTRGSFAVTASHTGNRIPTPTGLDVATALHAWQWTFTPEFR